MAFDFGESKPSDPTADFLAREREAAGVLSGDADLFGSSSGPGAGASADDFERSASAFPALDDDGLPAPTSATAAPSGGFGLDDIDDRPEPASATATKPVDDEVGKFEQNFPELDDGPSTNTNGATYHDDADDLMSAPAPAAGSRTTTTAAAAAAQPSYSYSYEEATEEPEPVRQWREAQKDAIAKRDAEGERKKAEAISQAEQDIDKFYAEYNAKKEKNIAANKESEAKFQEQRTRELAEGTTWTRVTKLVDLHNSQSKTTARSGPGSSDLSRMKELYLSLRREGETAPGAAGY